MINYVLDTSQQADLFYVGHSQGTIMGFAGFTLNQTLAKQIKAFFALAPVTTVKHIEGILQPLSDIYDIIYVSLKVYIYNYAFTKSVILIVELIISE